MRTDAPNVLAGARLVRPNANVGNLKWRRLPLHNFFLRLQALRGVCWQLNCTQRMELYSKENMKY